MTRNNAEVGRSINRPGKQLNVKHAGLERARL